MSKQREMLVYETDDINKARYVSDNYEDNMVIYHNRKTLLSPTLILVLDGKEYTKYNPAYVEYLKKMYPGISEDEIVEHIKKAISENEITKKKVKKGSKEL